MYPVIRLFGLFGYSQKPIRSNGNLALLGKIGYWICSIRNNRFVHLHSEVLRYLSSASPVTRIPFYDDIQIHVHVYDITCTIIITSNLKRNVIVVTIYMYVGTRLHVRTSQQISLFSLHRSWRRTAPATNQSELAYSAFRTSWFLASTSISLR